MFIRSRLRTPVWNLRHLLPLLLVILALPAQAQTDADIDPAADGTATPHQEFLRELDGIFAREAEQLSVLQAEFAAATDEEVALAVQRRMAEVREATEIVMLGAQAGYARRLGRPELAEQIEADIAELRDPQRAARKARPEDVQR